MPSALRDSSIYHFPTLRYGNGVFTNPPPLKLFVLRGAYYIYRSCFLMLPAEIKHPYLLESVLILLADNGLYCFNHRIGEKRHQDCIQSKDGNYLTDIHLVIFAFERNHDQSADD